MDSTDVAVFVALVQYRFSRWMCWSLGFVWRRWWRFRHRSFAYVTRGSTVVPVSRIFLSWNVVSHEPSRLRKSWPDSENEMADQKDSGLRGCVSLQAGWLRGQGRNSCTTSESSTGHRGAPASPTLNALCLSPPRRGRVFVYRPFPAFL